MYIERSTFVRKNGIGKLVDFSPLMFAYVFFSPFKVIKEFISWERTLPRLRWGMVFNVCRFTYKTLFSSRRVRTTASRRTKYFATPNPPPASPPVFVFPLSPYTISAISFQ